MFGVFWYLWSRSFPLHCGLLLILTPGVRIITSRFGFPWYHCFLLFLRITSGSRLVVLAVRWWCSLNKYKIMWQIRTAPKIQWMIFGGRNEDLLQVCYRRHGGCFGFPISLRWTLSFCWVSHSALGFFHMQKGPWVQGMLWKVVNISKVKTRFMITWP